MKSKYGTEISKDDYKEIMNLSKEINELFEEHYIKELRPEPIHPIKRMRNMSGQKAVNLYKSMLRSMLFDEQDDPGRRFNNWKEQLAKAIAPFDEEFADAVSQLTQEDYAELYERNPDLVNIKFYYDVILIKDKSTGETTPVDNTYTQESIRGELEMFMVNRGYLKEE